jgi:hypothetical protein
MTIKRTQRTNIGSIQPSQSSTAPAAVASTPAEPATSSPVGWTSAKTDIVRPASADASQNAVNHIAARALLGVLPVEQKVIDSMPAFLIGQESKRDAFQFLVKELLSPTRLHAPAIVLTGTRGHGQDQALEGLSHAVGQNGVVITVDAAQLNNPGEFAAALKEAPKGSVVRIVQVAGLATSKPAIAADIAQYISQPKGDKTSHHYVLDVEVASTEDARTAVGAVFNPLVVSTAAFAPLSATAMETYCRLRVEHLLQQQGMGHVAVGFGDGVLPLLGELLSTSHAPLHDIDTRLNQWLLSAFSTATDVTRDGGIVTVRLTDAAQDKNIVKDVTEQVHREVAHYEAAATMFLVHETGVFKYTKENTAEEIGYTTLAAVLQLEMQHTDVQALMKTSPVIATKVRALTTACKAMTDYAERQTQHRIGTVDASGGKLLVINEKKLQAWSDAYAAVQALSQQALQAAFDRAEEKTTAVVDRAVEETQNETELADSARIPEVVFNIEDIAVEPKRYLARGDVGHQTWLALRTKKSFEFFDATDENISVFFGDIIQPDHFVKNSEWTPHPNQVRFCARIFELGGHGDRTEMAKAETREWLQKIPPRFATADFAVSLVRLAVAVDFDPKDIQIVFPPSIDTSQAEPASTLWEGNSVDFDSWRNGICKGDDTCLLMTTDNNVAMLDYNHATPEFWSSSGLPLSPAMIRVCARKLEVAGPASFAVDAAREWLTRVPPEWWGPEFVGPLARLAVAAGMDASDIGFAGVQTQKTSR